MTKKAGSGSESESGSGSISQRYGPADPGPHQKVMDPQLLPTEAAVADRAKGTVVMQHNTSSDKSSHM
jgi:hypothetical protein